MEALDFVGVNSNLYGEFKKQFDSWLQVKSLPVRSRNNIG